MERGELTIAQLKNGPVNAMLVLLAFPYFILSLRIVIYKIVVMYGETGFHTLIVLLEIQTFAYLMREVIQSKCC